MTKPPNAVLGPCRCQGCGLAVWWARSWTRSQGQVIPGWLCWREATGRQHRCAMRKAA